MNYKLKVKNIKKSFSNIMVIDDITFNLEKGKVLALIGPSGSGKTTFLNIISGLDNNYLGNVYIDNKNPKISYMFQEDALLSSKSVYDNATLGLVLTKTKDKSSYKAVDAMLKEYDLEKFKEKGINSLSGGMKKRLSLIQALSINPDLLLLDEPFSALDYYTKIKVSTDALKKIREKKITTIIITHDIEEAIMLADKIIVLTKRPASIKAKFNVNIDKDLSLIEKKKTKEFVHLLEQIWGVMDE